MFDTLNVKVDRPLKPELVKMIEVDQGAYRRDDWSFRISPSLNYARTFSYQVFGQHEPTGIVLRGHNNVVELIQASLPRVLFAYNGRLIRSPQHFADAQERLKSILDEVTTMRTPLNEYVRVDLVLLSESCWATCRAHCSAPCIRRTHCLSAPAPKKK